MYSSSYTFASAAPATAAASLDTWTMIDTKGMALAAEETFFFLPFFSFMRDEIN